MPLEKVYVALDVETSGPRIGCHSMLSIGACVVPPKSVSLERMDKESTFYAELHPMSLEYDIPTIKVSASQLDALSTYCRELPMSHVPRYYHGHPCFDPKAALQHLQASQLCESPPVAMRRLHAWVKSHGNMKEVIPVVDTTFFDSGWINYYCSLAGLEPIFGHKSIDIRSVWAGMTNNPDASLKTVRVREENKRPHHALHDAAWLANAASMVLFEEMA